MIFAILLSILFGMPLPQSAVKPDPLAAVRFFAGRWHGTGTGEPGQATVEREYQFVLGGKFLQAKNVSRWTPTEKNPKGETHEDMGLLSYDTARKTIIYRQFHIEGFVNQYAMLPAAAGADLVFESEALENVPPGWKARETYHVVSPDEFIETFELSQGGPYEVYSRSRLRRLRGGKSHER